MKQRDVGKSTKHMELFVMASHEETPVGVLAGRELADWQSWQSYMSHKLRDPSDHEAILRVCKNQGEIKGKKWNKWSTENTSRHAGNKISSAQTWQKRKAVIKTFL